MSQSGLHVHSVHDELKRLYAEYRHTADIDAKGRFFSPACIQICRPLPSYAARNRDTIVRYLHEAAAKGPPGSGGDSAPL